MGGNQSAVRATHFQRPPPTTASPLPDDEPDEHHISITNKMVERLVEDATLPGAAKDPGSSPLLADFKETIYMEKLKCLDDTHSERLGYVVQPLTGTAPTIALHDQLNGLLRRLTVDEVKALTSRIEMRTSNMVSTEPVCADCQARVIHCYDSAASPADVAKCWDVVGAFTHCVQEAGAERLRARTERDARDRERRSRHVARAREHALRDLSAAHGDSPSPT